MARVILDIAQPVGRELDKPGDDDLAQPFVSGKLTLRDFVLPESVWSTEYAPFDEFADNSIFPVIDLAKLASGDEESRKETVAKLAEAAESWGFFKVVNHGVPLDLVRKNLALARDAFDKTEEEKLQVGTHPPGSLAGYTDGRNLGKHPCWHEGYLFPWNPDKLVHIAKRVWPDDNGRKSGDMLEYVEHMYALTQQLIELLVEGLGLPPQRFNSYYTREGQSCYRFLHYLPCPKPELAAGHVAHTDPQTITVVYQETGGLQILKGDKWLGVSPDPEALVVNIGDCFQAWSNGRYRSVKHRVTLNSDSRYSLIFFRSPTDETIIAPLPELTDQVKIPAKYRPFTWVEYKEKFGRQPYSNEYRLNNVAV